ncbi:putative pectin lyase/virulence factor [Helianthus anomalus]
MFCCGLLLVCMVIIVTFSLLMACGLFSLFVLGSLGFALWYSCKDMVIEDNYISMGDDAIAIKGGWDQYGAVYGRPSKNILIRNLMVLLIVR